ncbi:MAG: hypothetical protein M3332_12515 [Actinomycetota bacterium]|nr:hypothetical protein [Actinomycetota bacterium]
MQNEVDVPFPKPDLHRIRPIGYVEPSVHWFSQVTTPEADKGRDAVNNLYAGASMRMDRNFLKRLRSERNLDHLTALAELPVDAKLRRSGLEIRYEEGRRGPDFRVYRDGSYHAAVEVLSMFLRQDWNDDQLRWGRIADEINLRVALSTYYVQFEVRRQEVNPPIRMICHR